MDFQGLQTTTYILFAIYGPNLFCACLKHNWGSVPTSWTD